MRIGHSKKPRGYLIFQSVKAETESIADSPINIDSKLSTSDDIAFRECGNVWQITFSAQFLLSPVVSSCRPAH
jgi:hypothetical protein